MFSVYSVLLILYCILEVWDNIVFFFPFIPEFCKFSFHTLLLMVCVCHNYSILDSKWLFISQNSCLSILIPPRLLSPGFLVLHAVLLDGIFSSVLDFFFFCNTLITMCSLFFSIHFLKWYWGCVCWIPSSLAPSSVITANCRYFYYSSVQSLSCVQLFAAPWTAACQTSLSITNSRRSLRLTSIKSVMPSSHLILCCPHLILPLIPPSIRVFSNESTLHMRWPKY